METDVDKAGVRGGSGKARAGLAKVGGMTDARKPAVPAGSEDPTRSAPEQRGQVVVVTYNHIAAALVAIADQVGRPTVVLDHRDADAPPVGWLAANPLGPDDALVLCDHDAPDTPLLLRSALAGETGYVAMTGSRRRAEAVFAELEREGLSPGALSRLHVPAGLNLGGKAAGEIALSVIAEIVATSYDRPGGPMRND